MSSERNRSQNSGFFEKARASMNLSDLPKLRHEPGFWGGVIVRVATLMGFLILLNVGGDLTDQNELLFKGLVNFLQGICPYGQSYSLTTFGGPFTQDYFNYPPFAILFHIPTFIWPGPQSIGTIDFMPGFFLLHTAFDFIIYYRLHQAGHSRAELMLWVNPGMVFLDTSTFISLPLLLLTLTILNIDNPIKSGFYSATLFACYQLGVIFIPFILIYHYNRHQLSRTFVSMLPVAAILIIFLLWNPSAYITDLFIAQFGRNPINWSDNNPLSPYYNRYYPAAFLFMGSIPAIVFNIAIIMGVPPDVAPVISQPMMILVGILCLAFLVHFIRNPRKGLSILYPGIILALFIASTSEGIAHYWVMTITLPFLAWAQRGTLFSSSATSSKHTKDSPMEKDLRVLGDKLGVSISPLKEQQNETRQPHVDLIRRLFDIIDLNFGERYMRRFDSLPFISSIRGCRRIWPLMENRLTLELGSERGFGSVGIRNCVRTDLRPVNGVQIVCDAYNLPFRDHVFDRTWSVYLIHHIPDIGPFISEARRVSEKFYLFDFLPKTWLHYFSIVWDWLFFRERIRAADPKIIREIAPDVRIYPRGFLGEVLYAF
ncbi:MAG: class I SAM-dependent methyltransferase [Promethearchaeota archaeon]